MAKVQSFEAFNDAYNVINPLTSDVVVTPRGNEIDGVKESDVSLLAQYEDMNPGCVWTVLINSVDTIDQEDDEIEEDIVEHDDEDAYPEEDLEIEDEEEESEIYSIVPGIIELGVYCYLITEKPVSDDDPLGYVLDI